MNNYFVILAAGKSKRFHKNIAKQFYNYKNKDIIEHSIEKSLNSPSNFYSAWKQDKLNEERLLQLKNSYRIQQHL